MTRKITIAKNAGFCSGVRRAIKKAREAADRYGKVVMLGDIVHNEYVVEDLIEFGVEVIDDIEQVNKSTPVLFRSHGTKKEIWQKAQDRDLTIIDATCPLVLEIHKYTKLLEKEGRRIIIIGDHDHEEVEAISNQVKNPIVVSNPEEAKTLRNITKAGIVVQSTQSIENVQEIVSILVQKIKDFRFINTICLPTQRSHVEVKELAKTHNVMIIVGSFNSANTKRLTQIAKKINHNTYQVQGTEDIKSYWFKDVVSVGISAGASTPGLLVEDVAKKIADIP